MTQARVDLQDPAFGLPTDGATPIDDALLRAIRALDPVRGGTLRIPPGRHVVDSVDLSAHPRPLTLEAPDALLVKRVPADGGAVDHMFHDRAGACALTVVGGEFDLRGAGFSPGDTVSAFHGVRADDWSFDGIHVRDGIEEGLKLYSPHRLRVERSRFARLRNDGIQVHCLLADGHTGRKPRRGARDVRITLSDFVDIDDGHRGTWNGQGVTFNSSFRAVEGGHTVEDVLVAHNRFVGCLRGVWAEFNALGVRGKNLRVHHNLLERSHWFGIGFVGVDGGSCIGNVLYDTGVEAPDPPRTSSEVVAVLLSGAQGTNHSRDVVVDGNRIVDRRPQPLMQYGIWVKSGERLAIGERNRVRGATIRAVRR